MLLFKTSFASSSSSSSSSSLSFSSLFSKNFANSRRNNKSIFSTNFFFDFSRTTKTKTETTRWMAQLKRSKTAKPQIESPSAATKIKKESTSTSKSISSSSPTTFRDLKLLPSLIESLQHDFNPAITRPTEIQSLAIPAILSPNAPDVLIAARTGTGKTLAYALPFIHRLKNLEQEQQQQQENNHHHHQFKTRPNRPKIIVLVPSKELAQQTLQVFKTLTHRSKFSCAALYHGTPEKVQREALARPLDVLVATPGKFLLHRDKGRIFYTDVRSVVVDEADTLLQANEKSQTTTTPTTTIQDQETSKGRSSFLDDVQKIVVPCKTKQENLGYKTQFAFVLATMNKGMEQFVDREFPQIRKIVSKEFAKHLPNVKASFIELQGTERLTELESKLNEIFEKHNEEEKKEDQEEKQKKKAKKPPKVLVFCNSVASCRAIHHAVVERGFENAACFHGDLPNEKRDAYFKSFTTTNNNNAEDNDDKTTNLMIATDVAARGLDFQLDITHVINFDFPLNIVDYQHRIGRTGRMGRHGNVINFIVKRDRVLAAEIQNSIHGNTKMDWISADRKVNERIKKEAVTKSEKEKKKQQLLRQPSSSSAMTIEMKIQKARRERKNMHSTAELIRMTKPQIQASKPKKTPSSTASAFTVKTTTAPETVDTSSSSTTAATSTTTTTRD